MDSTNAKSNIYELNVSTTDISIPIINNVSVSNITSTGFTLTVNATSENEISKYYFIIDSANIAGITSENSYTFNNLEPGTSYNIAMYLKDINDNISKEYKIEVETDNGILLADYIKGLYTSQGANGIYYHTSSLSNSAEDNSYRYAGANPNNYVCFGSNDSTCPENNLYRIIGVFNNEVKLIKLTKYGDYIWDSNNNNIWSGSNIKDILNTGFINEFDSVWVNMIAYHTWKTSEDIPSSSSTYTAKQFYDIEEGSEFYISNETKIGLMYVSDYGFAVSNSYWTTGLNSYSTLINNNWLYSGLYEWTITRSWSSYSVFQISSNGGIGTNVMTPVLNKEYPTRPTFYLDINVFYLSGTGTRSDPIRIN